MKIAQITDLHVDDIISRTENINSICNFDTILEDIINRQIEYVVMTGDYGNYKYFDNLTDKLKKSKIKYDYILGNHDKREDFENRSDIHHSKKNNGLYFTKKIDNNLFLYLDSSQKKINIIQLDWMKKIVSEHEYDKLIIFIHHPILNCGNTTMDNLFPLENRDIIKEILLNIDKKVLIFCGHYHNNLVVEENNITQFLTSSAILQLATHSEKIQIESRDFGYRVIDFGKDIKTEAILMKNDDV